MVVSKATVYINTCTDIVCCDSSIFACIYMSLKLQLILLHSINDRISNFWFALCTVYQYQKGNSFNITGFILRVLTGNCLTLVWT